ncbi:uncharacterized protein Dyak_GE27995, isoform B [Drosophila yakuba]|uniref:Uncharacterized protein, isoform A n=1 Tax=Drosophila yakuba TaxID=7245 RepID=A0A0R1DSB7_DROYA|nr:uncharacterized protein Dyak_GE27995, isoform A [Drosophila yakuba]KRJ97945.1 uncharacterized protein Dyak_GE27995, isoform B [Drosophila yakuba]
MAHKSNGSRYVSGKSASSCQGDFFKYFKSQMNGKGEGRGILPSLISQKSNTFNEQLK